MVKKCEPTQVDIRDRQMKMFTDKLNRFRSRINISNKKLFNSPADLDGMELERAQDGAYKQIII